MHRQRRLERLDLLLCAPLLVLAFGCTEGRFPVCKTDAECQDAGKGNVCFDLRCVECHYDTDCKPGSVCGPTQTCKSLGAPAGEKEEPSAKEPPAEEPAEKEPATLAECKKRCADKTCRDACAQRFRSK